MYKLLIVEDERLIRERLKFLIKTVKLPLELVGEAKNGEEALALILEHHPDIVITDVRMPVMDGIELVKKSKLTYEAVRFIIISGYADFNYAREALSAGVIDYILKPVESIGLFNSLQKACSEIDRIKKTNMELKIKKELEVKNAGHELENILDELVFSDEADLKSSKNLIRYCPELEKGWYALIIFHISHPKTFESKFKEDDFNLIRFSIDNIIREICSDKKAVVFKNIRDKAEIIVLCHAATEQAVLHECKALASYCFIQVDKFLHFALTIGVSSGHNSLFKLSEGYRQAKFALVQRFTKGSNKIFNYGEVIPGCKYNYDFEPKLRTLDICLQNMNSHDSLKSLKYIICSIFSNIDLQGANVEDIKLLFGEVIKKIVAFCKYRDINANLFINEGAIRGDIISSFGNSSDIVDYIYLLIEKILQIEKTTFLGIKQLVHETERYIKAHFYEEISLNVIAEKNHVDLKHLSKVFKSIAGLPFSDYLMEIRLKRARELLVTTDMEIQEIAKSVGYSDHQYFHRLFKKKMSVTPNQFRMS